MKRRKVNFSFKPNYFFIPFIVFAVAWAGNILTQKGMEWYKTINLPDWTPGGTVIGGVWTAIFILSAIALLIVWNKRKRNGVFLWIILFFTINAGLNLLWSELFFAHQEIGLAMFEAGILEISVLILIGLTLRFAPIASALLVPYAVWVGFAIYLNYVIWAIN
jgi:tryptophan-rich sensory protein